MAIFYLPISSAAKKAADIQMVAIKRCFRVVAKTPMMKIWLGTTCCKFQSTKEKGGHEQKMPGEIVLNESDDKVFASCRPAAGYKNNATFVMAPVESWGHVLPHVLLRRPYSHWSMSRVSTFQCLTLVFGGFGRRGDQNCHSRVRQSMILTGKTNMQKEAEYK